MAGLRRNAVLLLTALALLPGCAALFPRPVGTEARLATLPRQAPGLAQPVTIRWNRHLVPWIEAESDTDLAYALGLVHGHLRGAQIEIMRLVARGRLAEIAGPIATDIDHADGSPRNVPERPDGATKGQPSLLRGGQHGHLEPAGRP